MLKLPKYTSIIKLLDLIDRYDLFLFDLWGVVLEADSVYAGALETANKIIADKNLMFLSNSPRTSQATFNKLHRLGFHIKQEMILTAGELTKTFLNNPQHYFGIKNPVIYNLGFEHDEDLWGHANLRSTQDLEKATLLIITFSSFADEINPSTYDILARAAKLNIPAICANNDRTAMVGSNIIYCAGHFAEKFESFGGKVFYMGKPFEPIFTRALSMYPDIDKKRVIMIGDTISTDILGANNMGIDSALVTTGNIGLLMQNPQNNSEKIVQIEQICSHNGVYPTYIASI
jgi:HAD superfamily hydrolase (TIGR01459 family)